MKTVVFEISDEEYTKILEEAKNLVRSEITREVVEEYLRESYNINIIDRIKELGIKERYAKIKNKEVQDLYADDILILFLQVFFKGLDNY